MQPQDLVVTLLGAYVHPRRRTVWSGGLVVLLGEFGFSPGAARVALTRIVRRELLVPERSGRLVHYALTPRATALLAEGDRRIFSLGRQTHAADTWTVLWHSIPEERRLERARLARRLRFLGFGSVQDGTWISPHDREREVVALLAQLQVEEHAGVLLGRPAASLDFRALATRAWDLDELSERYRAFATAYESTRARDDRAAFLVRTRLVHEFRRFASLDPELPDALMPAPRNRTRAVKLFSDLYDRLEQPAQRHFDAVTGAHVRPEAA
jgi:phenylacetic acid degradation operon negative regulatory protein